MAAMHKPPGHSPRKGEFGVLVMATVSAGKSTLINAIMGQELLHSANEATTACITSIEHRKELRAFSASCGNGSGRILARRRTVSPELVRAWNADRHISRITLKGCFPGATGIQSGLTFYDTPGPNNSQDERHARIGRNALDKISFDMLLYVLNAGNLGTNDDRAYLDFLRAAHVAGTPACFLLNKIDLLDPDRGESLEACVRHAHRYVSNAGFDKAIVIPATANLALYARKTLNGESLTRMQHSKLNLALEEANRCNRQAVDAAIVPDTIKTRLYREFDRLEQSAAASADPASHAGLARRSALKRLIAASGVRTVETFIHYQRQK